MLTELVKALEDKKTTLQREIVAIQEKQTLLQAEQEKLSREAGEKERELAAINEQAIKKYKILWRSYTPPNPFPCPVCFAFHKKISPLEPMARVEDTVTYQCKVCKETFEIPVELLYA
ncbi:MAG TPA: hypothetical protein VI298_07285 [Geobacteraceae bacterium]